MRSAATRRTFAIPAVGAAGNYRRLEAAGLGLGQSAEAIAQKHNACFTAPAAMRAIERRPVRLGLFDLRQ